MALQFILGEPGSGKSHTLYETIIAEAQKNPLREYLVIVPEQFTLSTQQKIVSMHPSKAILNIDVVSFQRLAYRVFSDVGENEKQILGDEGKNFILRKVVADHEEELTALRRHMKKIGYITEMKSVLSELSQYDVDDEAIDALLSDEDLAGSLREKLKDILMVRGYYRSYMEENAMPREEVLTVMARCVAESTILRGAVIALDAFTGFTPDQIHLLQAMAGVCEHIYVTATYDPSLPLIEPLPMHHLYWFSQKNVIELIDMARQAHLTIEEPILIEKRQQFKNKSETENGLQGKDEALQFLTDHIFREGAAICPKPATSMSIRIAQNPGAEAKEAARVISSLVREGYEYGQIAVVSGATETYGKYLRDAFSRAGIPFFLDEKKDALANPYVDHLRSLLALVRDDFSYDAVFRFLKHPYGPLEEERVYELENYILATGIRGQSRWKKSFKRRTSQMEKMEGGEALWQQINESRERFMTDVGGFCESLAGTTHTVREISDALRAYCEKNDFAQILEQQANEHEESEAMEEADEFRRIYDLCDELLDTYVNLLGDEEMTLEEYTDLLDAGFSELRLGLIPPGTDEVLIGDLTRTRLDRIRVLLLLGVNDGVIPASPSTKSLISDYERELLKSKKLTLSPTSREKAAIQKFYLYLVLSQPTERLYLTYSRTSGDGKSLRPSYLIKELRAMFALEDRDVDSEWFTEEDVLLHLALQLRNYNKVFEDPQWFSLQELMKKRGRKAALLQMKKGAFLRNPGDALSKERAQKLYGDTLKGSVSKLQTYADCPRAYFLQYGLKLMEREIFRYEALDEGNILHKALEIFGNRMRAEGMKWGSVDDAVRDAIVKKAIEETVLGYGHDILSSTQRNAYIKTRLEANLLRIVEIMCRQLSYGQFEPEMFEWCYDEMTSPSMVQDLGEGRTLKISGKIDRIDIVREPGQILLNLIDYKTGEKKPDITDIYDGKELQLPLYLKASMEYFEKRASGSATPAGLAYMPIEMGVIDREKITGSYEDAWLEAQSPKGWYNSDGDIIFRYGKDAETIQKILPVKFKNDVLLTDEKTFSGDELAVIMNYAMKKSAAMARTILDGDIAARPRQKGSNSPCAYCRYGPVCGFDRKIPGYRVRYATKGKKDELIELMEEQ